MGSGKLPVGQWLRIYYTYDGPVAIIYPPLNCTLFTISSSEGRSETGLWNLVDVFQRYLLLESIGRTWLNWMCFFLRLLRYYHTVDGWNLRYWQLPPPSTSCQQDSRICVGDGKKLHTTDDAADILNGRYPKLHPFTPVAVSQIRWYPWNKGKALRNILIYIVHPLFKRNFGCFFTPPKMTQQSPPEISNWMIWDEKTADLLTPPRHILESSPTSCGFPALGVLPNKCHPAPPTKNQILRFPDPGSPGKPSSIIWINSWINPSGSFAKTSLTLACISSNSSRKRRGGLSVKFPVMPGVWRPFLFLSK